MLKWIVLLPAYWIGSGIVWFISITLLSWFSSFGMILYWLTVPFVFIVGGIVFPFAIIIALLEELELNYKPALILILINNLIGVFITFSGDWPTIIDEINIFGIVFGVSSLLATVIFLFVKTPKEKTEPEE